MNTRTAKVHHREDPANAPEQDNNYVLEKLRAAAVMYGPSVALNLSEGACLLFLASAALTRPQRYRARRARLVLAATGALSPLVYLLLIRPWHLRWGATDEEVRKTLPGDELLPRPALESTRAITIRAPAEEVWRWLMQLGQNRGGFYSYDRLENLAGADIHNAERIIAEMQLLSVGDFVPMAPVEWRVPMGGFTVVRIEPERAIVWRQGWPDDVKAMDHAEARERGVWSFVLETIDAGTTRLILRERSGLEGRRRDVLFDYLFMERQHFVMVRKMLLGIKERAERSQAMRTSEQP